MASMEDYSSLDIANHWFCCLGKRNKLIALVRCRKGTSCRIEHWNNMELILESGISPSRRYIENGVHSADYPSFADILDSDLISLWEFLDEQDRIEVYLLSNESVFC